MTPDLDRSFSCGICMDVIDETTHPAPSSYATLMPCCNFAIHLRCAKLSFNHHIWSCPACRKEDSLKTDESKARFVTYLYLRSYFLPDINGSLDSNLKAINLVFQTSLPEINFLNDEPRQNFIKFYDALVLPNPVLTEKLSRFFNKIFTIAETSNPINMMDTFIEFERTDTYPIIESPIIRTVERRCEKKILYIACASFLALCIAITVLAFKKYRN